MWGTSARGGGPYRGTECAAVLTMMGHRWDTLAAVAGTKYGTTARLFGANRPESGTHVPIAQLDRAPASGAGSGGSSPSGDASDTGWMRSRSNRFFRGLRHPGLRGATCCPVKRHDPCTFSIRPGGGKCPPSSGGYRAYPGGAHEPVDHCGHRGGPHHRARTHRVDDDAEARGRTNCNSSSGPNTTGR